MRLLTHNMLHSAHKHGVAKGYPLKLVVEKTEEVNQEINKEFLKHRLPLINLDAFSTGCTAIGVNLIEIIGDFTKSNVNWNDIFENETKLNALHHALIEVRVIEGYLECPESGRKFPISDGIPNMLLMEDEIENVKYKNEDENEAKSQTSKDTNVNVNDNAREKHDSNQTMKSMANANENTDEMASGNTETTENNNADSGKDDNNEDYDIEVD